MRRAWPAIPPIPVSESDNYQEARAFGEFCRKYQEHGESNLEDIPLDPDTRTVHSPWREEIYHLYNHIFYDVMNFLGEAAAGVGHFHPPKHEVFALVRAGSTDKVDRAETVGGNGSAAEESQGGDGDGAVMKLKWLTNILLMPAYLAPGIKIRVTIADRPMQDGADDEGPAPEDEVVGTWDGTNNMEVWYLRAGVEIGLAVEGKILGYSDGEDEGKGENGGTGDGEGEEKGRIGGKGDEQASRTPGKTDGVGAVFVVGVLCAGNHQASAGI